MTDDLIQKEVKKIINEVLEIKAQYPGADVESLVMTPAKATIKLSLHKIKDEARREERKNSYITLRLVYWDIKRLSGQINAEYETQTGRPFNRKYVIKELGKLEGQITKELNSLKEDGGKDE